MVIDMEVMFKKDIEKLYSEYVVQNKANEYLDLSIKLPMDFLEKYPTVEFPRVFQISEFKRLVEKFKIQPDSVLNYNGPDSELEYLEYEEIDYINYEPASGDNDLHNFRSEKQYDFIIFMETIEHLSNPFIALENIYNSTKQGGVVFTSVPTVNKIHDYPFNFTTGYTPMGLAALFKSVGFEIMHIGQWGNRKYIELTFNHGWPTWRDMKNKSSLKSNIKKIIKSPFRFFQDGFINEFDYPVKTWIMAKKI